MTTFLLIRHASHDLLGKALAGRAPGLHLNAQGVREAERLASRLEGVRLHALYTSERERSRETAAPLASRQTLAPQVSAGVDEIDFGEWTSREFHTLAADPEWSVWNSRRSLARIPGGETIEIAQSRMVAELRRLADRHPEQTVAVVSHCDVIKCAVASYLGMSLDHLERFEIEPSSISIIVTGGGWAKVKLINGTGEFSSS